MTRERYSMADEQAYYSQRWPTRALPYLHLKSYIEPWLPEARALLAGKIVVDVGAGEATYTRMLAETYAPARVVACELFRERMLPAKRDNHSDRVSFVAGSCFALPFAQASVDAVFGSFILHQLPELDRAVAEIDRVLKLGGCYIGIEPNPRNPVVLYRFARGRHSTNQYLLDESHLNVFSGRDYEVEVRCFYARFPRLRSRWLTTCMGILARKGAQ